MGNRGTAREIMLERVSVQPMALMNITEELKGDREIVMTAVSKVGAALQYATEQLKGDREIVMTAVSQNGFALRCATEQLKGDREIVMAAVSQAGNALQFATEELKADREIVMTAVSHLGSALRFATKDLKEDEGMLQHALEGPGSRGQVVGIKVALLSGRCCSEVFSKFMLHLGGGHQVVLRHCAASLDLDPDYVRSSVASSLWRGLGHLQNRKAMKHMKQEGTKRPKTTIQAVAFLVSLFDLSPFLHEVLFLGMGVCIFLLCRWTRPLQTFIGHAKSLP